MPFHDSKSRGKINFLTIRRISKVKQLLVISRGDHKKCPRNFFLTFLRSCLRNGYTAHITQGNPLCKHATLRTQSNHAT
jgi:hypothetical protein